MRKFIALSAIVCLLIGAPALAAPRPGETPPPKQELTTDQPQSMQLIMSAGFVFPSPNGAAVAGIENATGSGVNMQYVLVVEPEELKKVAGIETEGTNDVELYRSEPLEQGGRIETIKLHTPIPEGTYNGFMMVLPTDEKTGEDSKQNFRVAITITVMADQREAEYTDEGQLNLGAHNSSAKPATLELVISASELLSKAGIDVYDEGCGFKPEDTFFRLFCTDEIPGYQDGEWKGIGLPDGSSLPEGEYTCWLIRKVDGQEPYGCAKVTVQMKAPVGTLEPDTMVMDSETRLQYAQAVVNTQYLLDMAEAN